MKRMPLDLVSPEFAERLKAVGHKARRDALAEGHPVVYRDQCGCYVQELPDGRKFEIRFYPGAPLEQNVERMRWILLRGPEACAR